jgi:energy-converting hydrogenase B subunit D
VTPFIAVALTLVLLGATATVLTGNPARQAVMLSIYGGLLGALFMTLSAPDVALSQIGVGTAIVPLVVMLAIRRMQSPRREN